MNNLRYSISENIDGVDTRVELWECSGTYQSVIKSAQRTVEGEYKTTSNAAYKDAMAKWNSPEIAIGTENASNVRIGKYDLKTFDESLADLKRRMEQLELEVKYAPGGSGYEQAKTHFQALAEE